jgi:general stress protein 26
MNLSQEQQSKIVDVLGDTDYAVIATNTPGTAPESALIAISFLADLSIIFGSLEGARKNANIARDPRVSLVIGWDSEKKRSLQIEGQARLITDTAERRMLVDVHCSAHEHSRLFCDDPAERYFLVTPTWIRYVDGSVAPEEYWEVSLIA